MASCENTEYPLNIEKYDNDIHYIFRYETEDEQGQTSTKAINFIPIFYKLFEGDPLDEFIACSNGVFGTLYPNQENSRDNTNVKKITQITYVVRDMEGVAYTTNDFDNYTAEIHFSIGYIFDYYKNRARHYHSRKQKHSESSQQDSKAMVTKTVLEGKDGLTTTTVITTTVVTTIVSKKQFGDVTLEEEAKNETLYEIRGVLSHELTHVWQFSCDGLPPNLIEGIADCVRLQVGFPAKHWVERPVEIADRGEENTPWNPGYSGTCYFLNWVQNNTTNTEDFSDTTFIAALNKQCRYRFTDKAFEFITGYNVNDLFVLYQTSLRD